MKRRGARGSIPRFGDDAKHFFGAVGVHFEAVLMGARAFGVGAYCDIFDRLIYFFRSCYPTQTGVSL
jgi:hypothetical protein